MKKLLLVLILSIVLVSCDKNESVEVEIEPEKEEVITNYTFSTDGQRYSIRIPFVQSKLRLNHERRAIYKEDSFEVTKQLQAMSAKHFNPEQFFISEGRVINEDLYNNLLRFESDKNSVGLNPLDGQGFETVGGNTINKPIIIIDLFEINYFESNLEDAPLSGMSLALVLNKNVTVENGQSDQLSEEDLIAYGENAARKLVSVVRQLPNMSQVPIFIGLYSLEKADSKLSGGFVSSGFFKTTSGQFEQQKQYWMFLPSTQASRNFPEFTTEFEIMKRAINDFIPEEQVGFVGEVRVIDNEINYMKLNVAMNGKTYLEVQGIIQYVKELIQQRLENFNIEVICEITVNREVVGVIQKKGNDVIVIYW